MAGEDELIKKLEDRRIYLDGRMTHWRTRWQDVVDYLMPWKADVTTRSDPGVKKTTKIYDNSATRAQAVLTAGLMGYLSSLTTLFYKFQTRDLELMDDIAVKRWLEHAEQSMLRIFNSSNFGMSLHEFYEDLTGFGTAAIFTQEHQRDVIRFFAFPPKDLLLAENADGDIDTVYRTYEQSIRAAAQEFGKESLHPDTRKELADHPDKPIEIVHVTLPRDDYDSRSALAKDMPYASLYYEAGKKHRLEESGYNEWPWAIARWKKGSRETYGRGPGIDNMSDIKTLQAMERSNLRAGEKRHEPPLNVPYDLQGRVKSFPNGINYYKDHNRVVMPWALGDPSFGLDVTNQRREAIGKAFFVDLFLLLQRAEEIKELKVGVAMEMVQERLMLLGPVVGRLHSEGIGPLIERSFGICYRANVFDKPPDILVDRVLDIVYVSPLAKAQAAMEARSTADAMQWLSMFVEIDPGIMDRIKTEELAGKAWEIFGAPTDILRTDEEVAEIQEAKAAQAQQAMAMEAMERGAAIDESAAKAEQLRGEA